MSDDLISLGAVQSLRLFRSGELSPSELLTEHLTQITRHDDRINAVTETVDDAKERAQKASERYRSGDVTAPLGDGDTALLGLPVATKEKHAIAGRTISQGLVAERDTIAKRNGQVAERIYAAGGLIHARTTSPEFSCATITHSPLWGVTRNPHNTQYSPGGSSGGAGAALAAGYTPLATSSDIAGSTRIPAAYSGVVGYKAPYGRVPGEPPFSSDWYRGDGAMARSVADTALLYNALSGVSARDHNTVPGTGTIPIEYPEAESWLTGVRVALCVNLGNYPVHPEIAEATRNAARVLEAAGAQVEEIELPWTTDKIREISMSHFGSLLVPGMKLATKDHTELADYTEQFMADSLETFAGQTLFDGLSLEAELQRQLAEAMAGYDVLLAPVNAVLALDADASYLDGIDALNEHGETVHLKHYWEGHMTVPFNIANRCPALAVPAGGAQNGMPIGVQFVGHPYQELDVFRAGAALEALQPWNLLAQLEQA